MLLFQLDIINLICVACLPPMEALVRHKPNRNQKGKTQPIVGQAHDDSALDPDMDCRAHKTTSHDVLHFLGSG